MASMQGFRCRQCRMELLAKPDPARHLELTGWTPPILCCGQSLQPLTPDQVLSVPLPRRRLARCPRCGYQVRVVIHPVGALVCMLCQREFVLLQDVGAREDRGAPAAAPGSGFRG